MAITNFEKFSTGGGGGANTIYTADDTIGSGRVATITDTLKFESVGGALYGGFIFKPALVGAGANEYAIISYGTREWFWHYRANEVYGFGMTDGNTSSQFIFNRGSLSNGGVYSGQCFNIITGTNTVGLFIEGAGSTNATSSLLIENSSADELFRVLDDGSIGISTTTPDASALMEMTSTTRGFLPPRMTTVEMNAIGSPAIGLMVYDTTTNQWMGYNGTSWVKIG